MLLQGRTSYLPGKPTPQVTAGLEDGGGKKQWFRSSPSIPMRVAPLEATLRPFLRDTVPPPRAGHCRRCYGRDKDDGTLEPCPRAASSCADQDKPERGPRGTHRKTVAGATERLREGTGMGAGALQTGRPRQAHRERHLS